MLSDSPNRLPISDHLSLTECVSLLKTPGTPDIALLNMLDRTFARRLANARTLLSHDEQATSLARLSAYIQLGDVLAQFPPEKQTEARKKALADAINACDQSGGTALHHFAQAGKIDDFATLDKLRANWQATTRQGWSTIHAASEANYPDMIELLAKCGVPLDQQDSQGHSALHVAAGQGNEKAAHKLMDLGADKDLVDANNWPPLRTATSQGQPSMVKGLLRRGAKLEVTSADGTTALYDAVYHGYDAITRMLLDSGANSDVTNSWGVSITDMLEQRPQMVHLFSQASQPMPPHSHREPAPPSRTPVTKPKGMVP